MSILYDYTYFTHLFLINLLCLSKAILDGFYFAVFLHTSYLLWNTLLPIFSDS